MLYADSFRFAVAVFLLTTVMFSAKAQTFLSREPDSLQQLLTKSKPDTHKVSLQLQLGRYLVYKPGELEADLNSARAYAEEARILSQKLAFQAGEIQSLNLLGTISREAKDLPKAIAYQKAAIDLSKRQPDKKLETSSHLFLAHALREKGDVQDARKEVQTAIDICNTSGYANEAGEAYIELGNTYANWGEELQQKITFYGQGLRSECHEFAFTQSTCRFIRKKLIEFQARFPGDLQYAPITMDPAKAVGKGTGATIEYQYERY